MCDIKTKKPILDWRHPEQSTGLKAQAKRGILGQQS